MLEGWKKCELMVSEEGLGIGADGNTVVKIVADGGVVIRMGWWSDGMGERMVMWWWRNRI